MKNCIIKSWMDGIGDCYWTGVGWLQDREKAKRFYIGEVETMVDNMRNRDEMVFWERYDKSRTSL